MKPIVVRGGGDIATGTICQLSRAGYPVLVLETEHPSAIRRQVAFCEAVYEGTASVEGLTAVCADSLKKAMDMVSPSRPVVFIDPEGDSIREIKPDVVVDAILAKRNLGTSPGHVGAYHRTGTGIQRREDVDYVIETMRGHNLGRIIEEGTARLTQASPERSWVWKGKSHPRSGRRTSVWADRDCRTGKKGRCHCCDQRRRRHGGACICIS